MSDTNTQIKEGINNLIKSYQQGQQNIYTATGQTNPFMPVKPTKQPPEQNPTKTEGTNLTTTQGTEPATTNPNPPPETKKDNTMYYIVGGVIIILIIGAYFFLSAKNQKRKP